MTNQEAREIIRNIDKAYRTFTKNEIQALEMAIKALEQESVLDKIRAEIKALPNANPSYWHSGDMVDRDDVLEIIDKHNAESEGTDATG